MSKMTKEQIKRQDRVDDAIFEMVNDLCEGLNLDTDSTLGPFVTNDIMRIESIRNAVWNYISGQFSDADEYDFYPSIHE